MAVQADLTSARLKPVILNDPLRTQGVQVLISGGARWDLFRMHTRDCQPHTARQGPAQMGRGTGNALSCSTAENEPVWWWEVARWRDKVERGGNAWEIESDRRGRVGGERRRGWDFWGTAGAGKPFLVPASCCDSELHFPWQIKPSDTCTQIWARMLPVCQV